MTKKKRSSIVITKAVLFALILREIRGKLGAKRLGAFWLIFEPLAQLAVMLAFFSFVRSPIINGVPTVLFLLQGIIPFVLFKNISLTGMQAVNANRGLFAYRQIQALDMIVARTCVETGLMMTVYMVVAVTFCLFLGIEVLGFPNVILWLLAMMCGISISFSLALVFCVTIHHWPEMAAVIRLVYFPLYLISGVVIPVGALPHGVLDYISWNPYLHIIEIIRSASIEHYRVPSFISLEYVCFFSIIMLFISIFIFRVNRYRVIAA